MSFGCGAMATWVLAATTLSSLAAVHYVDVNNGTPTPPFTNWATAARTIQEAVDAATAGDEILVTNGIYASGGRTVYGAVTNRVAVDKAVRLRSVNGAVFTVIQGYQLPTTNNNGIGSIRCVYLTNGASLFGFTLTSGGTPAVGDYALEQCGGGVWCEPTSIMISNCVLAGNSAAGAGGGAYRGTTKRMLFPTNVKLLNKPGHAKTRRPQRFFKAAVGRVLKPFLSLA